jgi:hypothetical protein
MFRSRPARAPEAAPHKLLPFDVRYALQYRDANLRQKDIAALFRNGFPELGFYLTMKATSENDPAQMKLLERVTGDQPGVARMRAEDAAFALETIEGATIKAAKIASISRYGMPGWLNHLNTALVQGMSEVPEETPVFMLANAPYSGLDVIMRHTVSRGAPLNILKPNRFGQTEQPVGFSLTPDPEDGTVAIDQLSHDFERPPEALLFDDMVRTNATMTEAIGFWCMSGADVPHTAAIAQVTSNY